jgi:peptidoglycan/LPS O-acetylase OafA/YrhL
MNKGRLAAKILSWRPFVFLGAFAYSLYLVHGPLLRVIWMLAIEPLELSHEWQTVIGGVVVVPVLVASACCFYLLAERPFVRLSARRRAVPGRSLPIAP